jgi:hypothetical protein
MWSLLPAVEEHLLFPKKCVFQFYPVWNSYEGLSQAPFLLSILTWNSHCAESQQRTSLTELKGKRATFGINVLSKALGVVVGEQFEGSFST